MSTARSCWRCPSRRCPPQEFQDYGRVALSQVDRAARLDNPDWQVLQKLKTDGMNLLLPEVQAMRSLARALQVRFRAEVARGRFDDAIRTAQTMFAMSRHLAEHPCLISDLVGIAIAFTAVVPLEEMLGQPGLPQPLLGVSNPAQSPDPPRKSHGGRADRRRIGLPRPGRECSHGRGPAQEIRRGIGPAVPVRGWESPQAGRARPGLAG